jgi:hypothetical protein
VKTSVGVATDVPRLLRESRHHSTDADDAVERGWLWREKLEGVWVYGTTEGALRAAKLSVRSLAEETLAQWLLGPMHPLSGFISKHCSDPVLSKNTARPFLRKMLRERELDAIAVLTNEYQPYIVSFRLIDREEVDRQLDFLARQLEKRGEVRPKDLPNPSAPRALQAWRDEVIQHGEYLGLGRVEAGALVAWP